VFCSVARFFGRAILRLTGWQHKGGKQPEQEQAKQQFLARRFFSSENSVGKCLRLGLDQSAKWEIVEFHLTVTS
jgi:hypothetical protein